MMVPKNLKKDLRLILKKGRLKSADDVGEKERQKKGVGEGDSTKKKELTI